MDILALSGSFACTIGVGKSVRHDILPITDTNIDRSFLGNVRVGKWEYMEVARE